MSKPLLEVIVASVREGRKGEIIANGIVDRLRTHDYFEIELVDLKKLNLPAMDEPNQPRQQRYVHEHTKNWSAIATRADAFLIVMPEYNHSFTGALKNALDYLSREFADKPVAMASYGGISGGLRAQQSLKPVLQAQGFLLVQSHIAISNFFGHIEGDSFVSTPALDASIDATHADLERYCGASKVLRG